ncbi:MAG: hypothetical protein IK128_08415 [Clostridiales bacterium]|nr:hypothetical protein [Clostridiales bacterium]
MEIKTWKYKAGTAEFCCLGSHKYVATGLTGRELLPKGRAREQHERVLRHLLAAWKSKYGNAEIPDLEPHIVTRAIDEYRTMDRAFFNRQKAGMNNYRGSAELTYKGVAYKSKSEREIARVYDELGIEFKYETPIYIDGIKFTPDFLGFSKLTGRCFYHEHQGRMGDRGYRRDKEHSHRLYSEIGLIEGIDIIYTYEGDGLVFNPENTKYELTALIMRNLDLAT